MTAILMNEVGGSAFDEPSGAVARLELGAFVAQIRPRRALRGRLHSSTYCVSADDVIGRRRRVLEASELRELVGLTPDQGLTLQLFGRDTALERLWHHRRQLLAQIAQAGYAPVIAPSFSLWTPRPRPEHLISRTGSQVVFAELQRLGAPVVPRLAWAVKADVFRLARWIRRNPKIESAALDLATYRLQGEWSEQVELLELFDNLTEGGLRYWVRGPSNVDRWTDLFAALAPQRITLTNARVIARSTADFAGAETAMRDAISNAAEQAQPGTAARRLSPLESSVSPSGAERRTEESRKALDARWEKAA